jgi:hypothetical protein
MLLGTRVAILSLGSCEGKISNAIATLRDL